MPGQFRTQFDASIKTPAQPGSRTKVTYGPRYDKQGRMYLIETGVHDLYAEIQSHADSVDIHVLLQRFAEGDSGALSRMQGAYGDFTRMPSTFAEALNTIAAAEQYFKGLPVDIRAKFGHDFNQFIASMDSPDWLSRVGAEPPPTPDASAVVAPNASSVPSETSQAPSTPSAVSQATSTSPASPAASTPS